jgi:UDP:flavonoid glycosyltransferase YjiC (YdhE family)
VKFVLASCGTRGDVEPCLAIGHELRRREHDVRMAVAPDLIGFVESAGLEAVACGPNVRTWQDLHRDFLTQLFRKFWKFRDLIRLGREDWQLLSQSWEEISSTLVSLADGADLLLTVVLGQESASNVAEYHDVPLAILHTTPMGALSQLPPFLPAPMIRSVVAVNEWLGWALMKKFEDAQRHGLRLPKAKGLWSHRMAERAPLNIQAYDDVCFPGLAAEWENRDGLRPFVGALAMELPTDADDEVASWVAAGSPPVFFGFGSTAVRSPGDTIAMISAACAELGERALICSADADFGHLPYMDHVKVVGKLNYAAVFPACRAVVHHGGAGTTAIGLRAGVPTLILSTFLDQTIWGSQIKRLKVGTTRRFSQTTQESLVGDLRTILTPPYVARARELATRMTKPAESVATAADLVEAFARSRVG